MAKDGYYTLRINENNEPRIRLLCERLAIDPDGRGAYAEAINFALRIATYEEKTMFTSIERLTKWLTRDNPVQYIVVESHPRGTFYYPVITRTKAARIATDLVKEAWERARNDGQTALLDGEVEVSHRTGVVYAEIDTRGNISRDAETDPAESAYFAKVFANAKTELS